MSEQILMSHPCLTAGLPLWKVGDKLAALDLFFNLQDNFQRIKIIICPQREIFRVYYGLFSSSFFITFFK